MADKTPFTWDDKSQRYRAGNGRFISSSTVAGELDKVSKQSSANMRELSGRLVKREIGISEWQLGMAQEIKTAHTAAGAAAKGGWAQMSQSDWGKVGAQIKAQYAYLNNFAQEIASGKQALNGQVLTRADMYGKAAHSTYEAIRGQIAEVRGMTEERRVLTPGENCPDCIDYAAQGWQPIGSLPRIGDSVCLTNCRCEFEYR